MKIEIRIDENCPETSVIITAQRMSDEINDIMHRLSERQSDVIIGYHGSSADILDASGIKRIFTANQKVFIQTESAEYTSRLRLYELEERLNRSGFVRISNTEIINLKKVVGFDLSFTGTICVRFTDGTSAYVSRRYVAKIKSFLGI